MNTRTASQTATTVRTVPGEPSPFMDIANLIALFERTVPLLQASGYEATYEPYRGRDTATGVLVWGDQDYAYTLSVAWTGEGHGYPPCYLITTTLRSFDGEVNTRADNDYATRDLMHRAVARRLGEALL